MNTSTSEIYKEHTDINNHEGRIEKQKEDSIRRTDYQIFVLCVLLFYSAMYATPRDKITSNLLVTFSITMETLIQLLD